MEGMGDALVGIGIGSGDDRGTKAARSAIASPLLEDVSIAGAQGVLVNVTGSSEMTLFEVNEAASVVYEEAGERANVIFGAVIDDNVGDEIRVTVIATGFQGGSSNVLSAFQPDKSVDFRPRKQSNLDVPTYSRRKEEAVLVTAGGDGNGDGNGNGKRRHLGEIDMTSDPPDLSIPTFVRRNKG